MTKPSSSSDCLFCLKVYDTGKAEVTVQDVVKCVTLEDAMQITSNALPELADILADKQDLVSNGTVTYPRHLVKTYHNGGNIAALLCSPAVRRDYKQKFKSSSETKLSEWTNFRSRLISLMGSEDAYLRLLTYLNLYQSNNDTHILVAKNYLFPALVCQVHLAANPSGLYGSNTIKYGMLPDDYSKETLTAPMIWPFNHGLSGIRDLSSGWAKRLPLPNFFPEQNMCFGSIVKQDLFDFKKSGFSALDFFIDVVHSSHFNLDLYHNGLEQGLCKAGLDATLPNLILEGYGRASKANPQVFSNMPEPNLTHEQLLDKIDLCCASLNSYMRHCLATMIIRTQSEEVIREYK